MENFVLLYKLDSLIQGMILLLDYLAWKVLKLQTHPSLWEFFFRNFVWFLPFSVLEYSAPLIKRFHK